LHIGVVALNFCVLRAEWFGFLAFGGEPREGAFVGGLALTFPAFASE
jgi:hypothetical protein